MAHGPQAEKTLVKTFSFGEQPVRIVDREGDPWFVAADVCRVLELSNPRQAIDALEEDEKGVSTSDTLGGPQEMNIISESGLYTLIFKSRKPKAKEFRRWVTGEVLPAIRKTGAYLMTRSGEQDHPVTLFLETIDQLGRRGVSAAKAAYSVGCLFQSSMANALASHRTLGPVRWPDPPPLVGPMISSRVVHGTGSLQKGPSTTSILEIARGRGRWRAGDLCRACMEAGLSRQTFYRVLRLLVEEGCLQKTDTGEYIVAEAGMGCGR